MDVLKEIKPPSLDWLRYTPSASVCPSCGGEMWRGSVNCPDGLLGCCVNHLGYTCGKCGRQWTV